MKNEWLIWSNEHGAWWAPNHQGYVVDVRSAGRYPYEEAMRIVHGANIGVRLGSKNQPNEAMVHTSVLDSSAPDTEEVTEENESDNAKSGD